MVTQYRGKQRVGRKVRDNQLSRVVRGTVLDVVGPRMSVQLATNGSKLFGIRYVGGPVSAGAIVEIDYSSGQPIAMCQGEEYVPPNINDRPVPEPSPLETEIPDIEQTGNSGPHVRTGWDRDYLVNYVSEFSFDDGTLTFTLDTTSGTIDFFINDEAFSVTAPDTVTITDTEGMWYIYYSGETLTASQTPWTFDNTKAFVCSLYWDATNNTAILFAPEFHTYEWPDSLNEYHHETEGTKWVSGLLVSDSGSDQLNVTSGEIYDEDQEVSIVDDDTPDTWWEQGLTPLNAPILYKDGASGYWRKIAASTTPCYLDTNVLQYNEWTGATWQLSPVTNNQYTGYFVFAATEVSEPVYIVMGQVDANTLAQAREDTNPSHLDFTDLPSAEHKLLARVIIRRIAASPYYEIIEVDDYRFENVDGATVNYNPQTFLDMLDTPSVYTGSSGLYVKVNNTEDGLEFSAVDAGSSDFTDLDDTPSSYVGHGEKLVSVTSGQDGLEFIDHDDLIPDFIDLDDTPSAYVAEKWLQVNAGGTALEFVDPPSGGGGGIVSDPFWFFDGAIASSTSSVGLVWVAPRDCTIDTVYTYLTNTGTSGLTVVDIHLNGSTIYTAGSGANRPVIAYDDADGIASGTPEVTSVSAGDVLEIYIDDAAAGAENLSVVIALTTYAIGVYVDPFWFYDGAIASSGSPVGMSWVAPRDCTIDNVYAYLVDTGVSGTTIIDIYKNGSTIYTASSGVNRPTVPYNDADNYDSGVPDITTVEAGDVLQIYIAQSATSAANLSVIIAMDLSSGGGGGGASDFLSLTDTPSVFSASSGKYVRVNSGETALEFVDPPAGDFVDLGDTPGSITAGYLVSATSGGDALEFIDPDSVGATAFLGLSDTPSSFSGYGEKFIRVNEGETALEFYTAGSPVYYRPGYLQLLMSSDQLTGLSAGDPVQLDTLYGSNIAHDTGTYRTTLRAGYTYKLLFSAHCSFSSSDGNIVFCWYDETNADWIDADYSGNGVGVSCIIRPLNNAYGISNEEIAEAMVTPETDIDVTVSVVSVSAISKVYSDHSSASIIELGHVGQYTERPDIYDDEERLIPGRWWEDPDNAGDYYPVYRKCVDLGALPNATGKSVAHGISDLNLYSVIMYGRANNGTDNILLPRSYPIANINVDAHIDVTNVDITTGVDYTSYDGFMVVEYAKTTDTPVGVPNAAPLGAVPAVKVYNTTAQTIPNDTNTAITFDSEEHDTEDMHSTSSNTSRLVCVTAGKYYVYATFWFASNSSGRRQYKFLVNSTDNRLIAAVEPVSTGVATRVDSSTLIDLDEGDYVELIVYQNSGGNLDVQYYEFASPIFGMIKIGD